MGKLYNLEERTLKFAQEVRSFTRKLLLDVANREDAKQLVRASGSVGANYIEANEKLGEKDLKFRLKISRKEAKETIYWLNLVSTHNDKVLEEIRLKLISEAKELRKILSAIINKL